MCSICTDELTTGTTTLECGHTFHVACAIQWFRYHNTTCPLCRAESEAWRPLSSAERVRLIARRSDLPSTVRTKVRRLKEWRAKRVAAARAERDYRRDHASVIREHRRLMTSTLAARRAEWRLFRTISVMEVPNVPRLVPPSESDSE